MITRAQRPRKASSSPLLAGTPSIALFFGGPSAESDISILTAHELMRALDSSQTPFHPLYITTEGKWLCGDALLETAFFEQKEIPYFSMPKQVELQVEKGCSLVPSKPSLIQSLLQKPRPFQVALLACHGQLGEDGALAGLLELQKVPYTGMRYRDACVAMNKELSKMIAQKALERLRPEQTPIKANVLPSLVIARPARARHLDKAVLEELLCLEPDLRHFPLCVKPVHLGSSIAVARVTTLQELQMQLNTIFALDTQALVEPYIEDKREFNIAVAMLRSNREPIITCSRIEEPINEAEQILDFEKKYRSGHKHKAKGLSSAQRILDPSLKEELKRAIEESACAIFEAFDQPSGAPRLDFLYDCKKEKLYFNEINPCPGSMGHYLWRGHPHLGRFCSLVEHLIEEALFLAKNRPFFGETSIPNAAKIFQKPALSI